MKKKISYLVVIIFIMLCFGCSINNNKDKSELSIVTTIFPAYDFTRAIVGNTNNITLLLSPGSELHTYEPTPKDIIKIRECDIFIYNGGESDEWVKDILDSIDISNKIIIKMMDVVNLLEEETVQGMEEDHVDSHEKEYDEHVWTSPVNAIKIVDMISKKIEQKDSKNKTIYEENSKNYINKLSKIDLTIRDIVNSSKRKVLVFGDRFPLRYFVEEYNLEYYAAFPGCSSKSEPSAKTISFLIDKINKEQIPTVLYLELSNQNISNTLKKETSVMTREFSSIHNISRKDFDKGLTYIDIMNKNIKVLKEALN